MESRRKREIKNKETEKDRQRGIGGYKKRSVESKSEKEEDNLGDQQTAVPKVPTASYLMVLYIL